MTPLMNSMKELKMGSTVSIELNHSDMNDQGQGLLSGLYSIQLEAGETFDVFDVTVHMLAEQLGELSGEKVVKKVY